MTKFDPSWNSLQDYTPPEWYRDAKFGIFIHWGPYAVPKHENEWYPRYMYADDDVRRFHEETYGALNEFGYKDFILQFRGEHFDPVEWGDLFVESGAEYVVPVAEHHDGFAMYDSTHTKWNAADMGPERDVIGELAAATRDRGLRFGVSSHYALNWRYYPYDDDFDTTDPANAGLYCEPHAEGEPASQEFLEEWFNRSTEIIDQYRPDLLYFDFGWECAEFAPYRPELLAYYYNRAHEWGDEVVVNYKDQVDYVAENWPPGDLTRNKFPPETIVYSIERGRADELRPDVWQTDTSISNTSWGHVTDQDYKSVPEIVHGLVDIVSKNGNLLLNIGPKANGRIPEREVEVLREIGAWLETNGEAIYGSRPWLTYGEGPTVATAGHKSEQGVTFTADDVRFTSKGDSIYAIFFAWDDTVTIETLATNRGFRSTIDTVTLLGDSHLTGWTHNADGLQITLPNSPPCSHAYTLEIQ
jgi:alpha-L-fucosidase